MARGIALDHAPERRNYWEALRVLVVCGCAIALIAAERMLPSLPF